MSLFLRWGLLSLLGLSLAAPAYAAERPFRAVELKRFISDCVPFLELVRTNGEARALESIAQEPRSISEFPRVVRMLESRSWAPERFAYILNHVLVAYQRLGMGGRPQQLLERLEESRAAVAADAKLSEAERTRALALIAQAQRNARKTDKAFAQIPAEEIRLLVIHRAELQTALRDRLPLAPRVLPSK
jgi:hypothetical protein